MEIADQVRGTDREPSENGTGFADQARTNMEPRHYTERQFDRNDHYRGPLDRLPEKEVEALLTECLRYFSFTNGFGLPLPPIGLPGCTVGSSIDDREHDLIAIGYRYFKAIVKGEGRAMHNAWDRAGRMLQDAYARGYSASEDAATLKYIEDLKADNPNWPFVRSEDDTRLVYFIASETGPIKIGLATNVQDRLKALQTAHPAKLKLLATCDGGQSKEREYHRQFTEHRLSGEWFTAAPEILAEIERLNG